MTDTKFMIVSIDPNGDMKFNIFPGSTVPLKDINPAEWGLEDSADATAKVHRLFSSALIKTLLKNHLIQQHGADVEDWMRKPVISTHSEPFSLWDKSQVDINAIIKALPSWMDDEDDAYAAEEVKYYEDLLLESSPDC